MLHLLHHKHIILLMQVYSANYVVQELIDQLLSLKLLYVQHIRLEYSSILH